MLVVKLGFPLWETLCVGEASPKGEISNKDLLFPDAFDIAMGTGRQSPRLRPGDGS